MAQLNTFFLLKFILIFYQINSLFSVNFHFKFNNQKHLWVIDFIKNGIIIVFLF